MTEGVKIFWKRLRSHSITTHTLVAIFGISAWLGTNGIYVQLPLLVSSAPEKWTLAVYLVIMIQSANIGPIAYAILKRFFILNDAICISFILCLGIAAMSLLAFFHDITATIGGSSYSLPLFICSFLTAIIGCTSSILFLPYLKNFNVKFLASYFIGEGLSGVIPSVIALIQGTGTAKCELEPLFTSRTYFLIISAVLLFSLCGFSLLRLQNEKYLCNDTGTTEIDLKDRNYLTIIDGGDVKKLTKFRIVYLHVLVGSVCFFGNGVLPAIQTYSCLPYGRAAYHLAVTLAHISNPLACIVYVWVGWRDDLRMIDVFSGVSLGLAGFVTFLAACSPDPPLKGVGLGVFVMVMAWVIIGGLIAYLKVAIASVVRDNVGGEVLGYVGGVMQGGSAIGGVTSFVLINFAGIFHEYDDCKL